MRKIIINIHSFIDVITNSSTEIYVSTHGKTEEMAKELVNKVLKAAGSDKKAEDIFTFQIEDALYELDEEGSVEDRAYDDKGNEMWIPENEEPKEGFSKEGYEEQSKSRLVITAKNDDKASIDLCDYLEGMLDITADYNG